MILVLGVVVGWYVLGPTVSVVDNPSGASISEFPTPTGGAGASANQEESTETAKMIDKGGVATRTVVTYTDTGFAPTTVTVKTGTTVTFVNESNIGMWVASAVHPTHQLLPGLNQTASVAKAGTYEYAFTKIGTWKYHNHMNPTQEGTVIVTQ